MEMGISLCTKNGTSHKFRVFFVFSQKNEVITLQLFVLLSFFQRGGFSLVGEHSLSSLCFVMPEDDKIILTSFFCSCVNTFDEWMTVVSLWKQHSSSPHPLCFSSLLSNIFLHLQRRVKPNRVCCVLGAKFISNVDETHSGIMSWSPKTIKPWLRKCRLKWCCTEHHHHHHNLERPSLAERRESIGPESKLYRQRPLLSIQWKKK